MNYDQFRSETEQLINAIKRKREEIFGQPGTLAAHYETIGRAATGHFSHVAMPTRAEIDNAFAAVEYYPAKLKQLHSELSELCDRLAHPFLELKQA